jgi:hypothetical protein
MSDKMPQHDPTGERTELPADLLAIDGRLTSDARLWATRLPTTERLDAHARALPQRLAGEGRSQTTNVMPLEVIMPEREPHMEPAISAPPAPGRLRTLFAAVAAIAVVGLLAALLLRLGARQTSPGSGGGQSATPTSATTIPTPATTIRVIPGPQSAHLQNVVTAAGVDAHDNPVDVTSRFQMGQAVDVAFQTPGIAKHTISVIWMLNGVQIMPASTSMQSLMMVNGSTNGFFSMIFSQSGHSVAKLYWDLPTSDANGRDDLLAWTINFTIVAPAVAGTPSGQPTPTPTPVPLTPAPIPTVPQSVLPPTSTVPPGRPTPTPPATPTPTPRP